MSIVKLPSKPRKAVPVGFVAHVPSTTITAPTKARQRPSESHPDSLLLDPWLTVADGIQGQPIASLIAAITPTLPFVRADAIQRRAEVLRCLIANFAAHSTTLAVPQANAKARPSSLPSGLWFQKLPSNSPFPERDRA